MVIAAPDTRDAIPAVPAASQVINPAARTVEGAEPPPRLAVEAVVVVVAVMVTVVMVMVVAVVMDAGSAPATLASISVAVAAKPMLSIFRPMPCFCIEPRNRTRSDLWVKT